MAQPLWKTVWRFITKLNILLPYNPLITLLGIYPKEPKTYMHTKTCTWIFIAAFFTIANSWTQPRCPSVGEWITWRMTSECYSAPQRNERSSHENTRKNLTDVFLRERRPREKATYCPYACDYLTLWKRHSYGDN